MKLLRVICALILTVSALSCTPGVETKEAPLGKEASNDEYSKVLDDALDGISIGNALPFQYVTYVQNQQIELSTPVNQLYYRNCLKRIYETDDKKQIGFEIFQDIYVFDTSTQEPSDILTHKIHSFDLKFNKATLNFSRVQAAFRAASSESCDGIDVVDGEGNVYDCTKIFNLIARDEKKSPPQNVVEKPNCMDIPECMLNVKHIEFDEVKWKAGRAVVKTRVEIDVVKDVPHLNYEVYEDESYSGLPPALSMCVKRRVPYNGSNIIVSSCTFLNDFSLAAQGEQECSPLLR